MLKWYEDNKTAVFFSLKPHIDVRYIYPYCPKRDKKKIQEKPFLNKEELNVTLWDYTKFKEYEFTIPKDYSWDGASIPRIFWSFIGSKTDNRFLIPSLIHDVLCENKNYVDNDRYFSTRVFERLLYVSKVSAFDRWIMFHSVDNFQKFQGWNKK